MNIGSQNECATTKNPSSERPDDSEFHVQVEGVSAKSEQETMRWLRRMGNNWVEWQGSRGGKSDKSGGRGGLLAIFHNFISSPRPPQHLRCPRRCTGRRWFGGSGRRGCFCLPV